MGNNMKHICQYINIKVEDLLKYDYSQLKHMILNTYNSSIVEENIRLGCQIRELVDIRDNVISSTTDFTLEEMTSIISFLCTE